jgi:hypothetical protein
MCAVDVINLAVLTVEEVGAEAASEASWKEVGKVDIGL